MSTVVYVDGFNLYYGAVKDTPWRWLNLKELALQVLPPGHTVTKVKYFTARVSGAADPDAPRRQQVYLNALRTVPEIEIHFGRFLAKTIWRPLVNLPVANETIGTEPSIVIPAGTYSITGTRQQSLPVGSYPSGRRRRRRKTPRPLPDALIAEVHTMEEKGSDVNLAAHLINDAWKGSFDAAAVISNDTDLIEPIRIVTVERGKNLVLVCPGRWQASPPLARVATQVRHIHKAMLVAAQFPDPIPRTTIRKPPSW